MSSVNDDWWLGGIEDQSIKTVWGQLCKFECRLYHYWINFDLSRYDSGVVQQETILILQRCILKYLGGKSHGGLQLIFRMVHQKRVCVCILVYACTFRWCMYSIMHTRVYMCTCFVCVGFAGGVLSSVPDTWQVRMFLRLLSYLPSLFSQSPVGAPLPVLTWVFPILFLAIFFCFFTYSSKPKWSLFRTLFETTIYKTNSSFWHLLLGHVLGVGILPSWSSESGGSASEQLPCLPLPTVHLCFLQTWVTPSPGC